MEGKPSLSHLGAPEIPLREIHLWLSPEAEVGLGFCRPQHQSSKFRRDTTVTRLPSLLCPDSIQTFHLAWWTSLNILLQSS